MTRIDSRKKIRDVRKDHLKLLSENHRYVFTLIHKFSIDPEKSQFPPNYRQKNIIVISDEAHEPKGSLRSKYEV